MKFLWLSTFHSDMLKHMKILWLAGEACELVLYAKIILTATFEIITPCHQTYHEHFYCFPYKSSSFLHDSLFLYKQFSRKYTAAKNMLIIFIILAFIAIIAPSEADYCHMARDDTLYIYPKDDNNCSKFIVCHHNEKYELSCLQASLFLYSDERLCLEDCRQADPQQTSRSSRNSYDFASDYSIFPAEGVPAKTILCPPSGTTLAAIPQVCNEYIECKDGVGSRQKCEDKTEFSPSKFQCEEASDCSTKRVKGTPHSKCRFEKGTSSTLLLPSEKCSAFKTCAHLMAWTITCAQNTNFNQATKTCDWEDNVECAN